MANIDPNMTALLKAVRTRIQAALVIDSKFCEIDPEAQPVALNGPWKISIGAGPVRRLSATPVYIKRSYGVRINVSKRISEVPIDRRNHSWIEQTNALEKICERIIPVVHSYAVTTEANLTITTNNLFYKPLYYESPSDPEILDGSWARLDSDKGQFLVMRMRFDGAELIQTLDKLAASTY